MAYVYDRLQEIENDPKIKSKRERAKKEIIKAVLGSEVAFEPETRHVYFVKMGEFVKIGFSAGVMSRMKNLNVGFPQTAELLAVIPGTKRTEVCFHQIFAGLNTKGEWFRFEGELEAFMSVAKNANELVETPKPKRIPDDPVEGPWFKPKKKKSVWKPA
ncbi:GIY-YIG nuclease family protein [Rhizobium sp.]|uniref:GIY-YIG nuclease family protein n=1 Tax=Rhizobium sp. TaxID=391 RepID=UPI003F808776